MNVQKQVTASAWLRLCVVCAALLLLPMVVAGATMQAGEEVLVTGDTAIEDNAYFAGGNVSIGSLVQGDLYAAGGNVLVSETVRDDIVVAGGSVTVLGDSGGDVRVAGGNVLVAGNVGGELIVAGGSITVAPDVSVGGDVVLAGGQVTLGGTVAGDVKLAGGQATISGRVTGDVVADIEGGLTITEGAVIDGSLVYKAENADALVVRDGAVVSGAIAFEQRDVGMSTADAEAAIFAAVGVMMLGALMASLVTALVLIGLFKQFSQRIVRGVIGDPLRQLGYGLVALVVIPVAAIVLFVTLLGIPLGILVVLAYLFLLLLTSIYTGVVVGAWLSQLLYTTAVPTVTWKNVTLGVIILALVKLVPVIGWIIGLLVFLVTLGSIAELAHKRLWTER